MMTRPEIEEVSYVFDSLGGVMKCPTCGENTPDSWTKMHPGGRIPYLQAPQAEADAVFVDWMVCANDDCKELVIRIQESRIDQAFGEAELQQTTLWFAR